MACPAMFKLNLPIKQERRRRDMSGLIATLTLLVAAVAALQTGTEALGRGRRQAKKEIINRNFEF